MFQNTLKSFKAIAIAVLTVNLFVSFFASSSSAQTVNKTLGYFDGALQVQLMGPKTLAAGINKDNTFTIQINDANGTPYPAITKEFVKATVEMTSMDMGTNVVNKISDILDSKKQFQGKLAINPSFSMKGPWKINLSITVSGADGNPMTETQFVTFDVNN
ncbi:MAG: hypothetical protein ACXVCY_07380 [Pseudobdellovibrionaceae bacterium]